MPDEDGLSIVTKLSIKRFDTDTKGEKRRYPWIAEIENGRGIAVRNSNGGTYCQKNSYICDAQVSVNVNDLDMFRLFAKTEAWIRAFEQEYAFRSYLLNLFNKLYLLIKKEISGQTEVIIRHIDRRTSGKTIQKAEKQVNLKGTGGYAMYSKVDVVLILKYIGEDDLSMPVYRDQYDRLWNCLLYTSDAADD